MSMLPRLKPKDILRHRHPGRDRPARPDPGRHGPSLSAPARGQGEAGISRPRSCATVLEKTLGVPLFQEQAMKVAIVGAGFTPAEADALRRSMATFKSTGGVSHFQDKMIDGMVGKRLYARLRRAHLQADRGLRQLRLPREPRGELRQDRLRLVLDEMPSSRHLLRGPAQRPADGLLRARPAGPRRAASMASRCARSASTRSRWDCTLEDPPLG